MQSNKVFLFKSISPEESEQQKLKAIKEKIDKYKENIFYTVGNPIHISNPNRFHGSIMINLRKKIPAEEIYASFKGENTDVLKLFDTKDDAIEYSRYLRTGNQFLEDTEVYQPAIFKVIYLDETNNVSRKKDDLLINPTLSSSNYDWQERKSLLEYFETTRNNVLPLEGTLMIHHGNKDNYVVHGPISYNEIGLKEKSVFSFDCTIS